MKTEQFVKPALACVALSLIALLPCAGNPAAEKSGSVSTKFPDKTTDKSRDKSASKTIDCCVLSQSCVVTGDHRVTISKNAIRDEYTKSGAVAILRVPFDEIVIFNAGTKIIYKQKLANYHGFFQKSILLISGRSLSGMTLNKIGSGTLKGLQTEIYRSPPAAVAHAKAEALRGESRNGDPACLTLVSSIQVADNLLMSKFLSISYGLPLKPGIPLKADYLDADDDPHPFVETSRCLHSQLPESTFNIPPGLKPAADLNAVFLDKKVDGAELLF